MEFRFLRALAIAGALVFFVACAPVENKEVQVEPPLIVAPTRAPTEIANDAQTIARATETRAPARAITLDLSDDKPDASAQNRAGVPVYTAFDFLRGYLTNQTHAIFFEGKPWTNS
ncbi:MAG: hypothetical protein HY070_00930, partial [Chloroflexi bacterium]|nr:hypothetical protein [Chloroflexota bacterium]